MIVMRKVFLFLFFYMISQGVANATPFSADFVVVKKSERSLMLFSDGRLIKRYKISLGDNPIGHKKEKGDEKTPEGRYFLTYKKRDSQFYKSIHITYPNSDDRKRAYQDGVNPGGSIKIHGLPNNSQFPADIYMDFDWTDGCIGVANNDMDEIWSMINGKTPIEILE